jgi:hypothetical protein
MPRDSSKIGASSFVDRICSAHAHRLANLSENGEEGRDDGPYADTLKDRPRNFSDCKTVAVISDETAFKAIKEGGMAVGLGDGMPSWGPSLTDEEIHSLLKYVRQFCVAQNSSPKPTMRPNTID